MALTEKISVVRGVERVVVVASMVRIRDKRIRSVVGEERN